MTEANDAPTGLLGTAKVGSRLDTLRVLRDRLASEIDVCDSSRDVAALSLRLMDVLEQIEAVEKTQAKPKGTPADELAARRTASGRPVATRQTRAARTPK